MKEFWLFIANHWELCSAFFTLLVLLSFTEFLRAKRGEKELSTAAAIQLINHHNAMIIDVRAANSFANQHILDAVSIPTSEAVPTHKILEKNKQKPLIIVCDKGVTAQQLTQTLVKSGYKAQVLKGGMQAWISAGLPVIRES